MHRSPWEHSLFSQRGAQPRGCNFVPCSFVSHTPTFSKAGQSPGTLFQALANIHHFTDPECSFLPQRRCSWFLKHQKYKRSFIPFLLKTSYPSLGESVMISRCPNPASWSLWCLLRLLNVSRSALHLLKGGEAVFGNTRTLYIRTSIHPQQ